jgi:hypothetical protein
VDVVSCREVASGEGDSTSIAIKLNVAGAGFVSKRIRLEFEQLEDPVEVMLVGWIEASGDSEKGER